MSLNSLTAELEILELKLSQVTAEKNRLLNSIGHYTSAINEVNNQLNAPYPLELSIIAQNHKTTALKLRTELEKKVKPLQTHLKDIESREDNLNTEIQAVSKRIRKGQLKKQTRATLTEFINLKSYE